jgi:hypothetical protein
VKLATFTHEGRTRLGLVDASEIVDLAAAVPDLPREMCAFLRAGRPALDAAQHALAHRSARLRQATVAARCWSPPGFCLPSPAKFSMVEVTASNNAPPTFRNHAITL